MSETKVNRDLATTSCREHRMGDVVLVEASGDRVYIKEAFYYKTEPLAALCYHILSILESEIRKAPLPCSNDHYGAVCDSLASIVETPF